MFEAVLREACRRARRARPAGRGRVGLSRSLRRRRARVAAGAQRDRAARRPASSASLVEGGVARGVGLRGGETIARRRGDRRLSAGGARRARRRRRCAPTRRGGPASAALQTSPIVSRAPVARSARHRRGDHRLRRLAAALDLPSQQARAACATRRRSHLSLVVSAARGLIDLPSRRDRAGCSSASCSASCPAAARAQRAACARHQGARRDHRAHRRHRRAAPALAEPHRRAVRRRRLRAHRAAGDDRERRARRRRRRRAGARLRSAARPRASAPTTAGAFVPLGRLKRPEVAPE